MEDAITHYPFEAGFDKLVDGLLDPVPVGALIFQHHAVDRKTSVHLEIENRLRLLKGQEAVLHQPCNEIFFAQIGELFQHPGGGHIINIIIMKVEGSALHDIVEKLGL